MAPMNINDRVKEFFEHHQLVVYKKGETIVRAEDTPEYAYYVEDGFIRQYALSYEGEELTLNIYRPGSYFSISWLLGQEKNDYFFETLDTSQVRRARLADVRSLLLSDYEVLKDVTRRITVGLQASLLLTQAIAFGNARQKVSAVLVLMSRRFGVWQGNTVTIIFPLTHRLLATMLGLARETTSLEISGLRKDGILKTANSHMMVTDYRRLVADSGLTMLGDLPSRQVVDSP